MDISAGKKIKMLLAMQNKTVAELAREMGETPGNLTNKLARDNFSEKDLRKIAQALGCKYTATFTLDNGDSI